ncbi:hypothetical protein AB0R11_10115, partial [Streptomyces fradiae]
MPDAFTRSAPESRAPTSRASAPPSPGAPRPAPTGAPPPWLYMVTGGRSEADDSFDLVTLVVSEGGPTSGM